MSEERYSLLRTFRSLFEGKPYRHRASNLGDLVASQLYEDLVALGKSAKLTEGVQHHERVVNLRNLMTGKPGRRGDGTFGELVPATVALVEEGMLVARGPVATIEIGAETKILAKAMIKQIDRVITDLVNQAAQFKRAGETRFASPSSASTLRRIMSPSKAQRNGQQMANDTSIQFRRLFRRNNALTTKHAQRSMNSSSCDFEQLTQSRTPLSGSTSPQRKWSILLY